MAVTVKLETKSDAELEELRIAVQTEQEERALRARIPRMFEEEARRFIEFGGDPAELEQAVKRGRAPVELPEQAEGAPRR